MALKFFSFPPANYLPCVHLGHSQGAKKPPLPHTHMHPSSRAHTYITHLLERIFLLLTLHLNERGGLS